MQKPVWDCSGAKILSHTLPSQNHRLADTLRRLLRRNAGPNIKKIMGKIHPVDLANVISQFPVSDQTQLLPFCGDYSQQAEVLSRMSLVNAAALITEIDIALLLPIIGEMSADDQADLLAELEEDLAHEIMASMPSKASDELQELMRYDENTAGGIMNPDVMTIPSDVSAAESIHSIQKSPDIEMVFYLYVVDDHNSLVGVLSLRQLVISRPEVLIKDIMNPNVVSVRTEEDQEQVARLVSKYDFLAVPVVDETNTLVGVVTVDDVIDVIREEATEDILKMAGAGDNYDDNKTIFGYVWRRAPWLFAALVGGLIASVIIGRFEEMLARNLPLVAFIPVIIGMAGNVGTQSLAIIVRGIATGRVDIKQFWKVIGKEITVGIMLGLIYGALLGAVGLWQFQGSSVGENAIGLALAVGVAAAMAMVLAAVVATSMPLVFARLNIDPAVATGPFVTTAIDILGVIVYFNIITMIV